jgi:hypothetical protein
MTQEFILQSENLSKRADVDPCRADVYYSSRILLGSFVIRRSFSRLSVMTNMLSEAGSKLEIAYRELLELREQLRKAERAAKSAKSQYGRPAKRRRKR